MVKVGDTITASKIDLKVFSIDELISIKNRILQDEDSPEWFLFYIERLKTHITISLSEIENEITNRRDKKIDELLDGCK